MWKRRTQSSATFSRSFPLSSVADAQRPGTYQVIADEKRVDGLTVTGRQGTARRDDTTFPASARPGIAKRDNTRRYTIEVKDIATDKSVCAVAADWTEYEKSLAVDRIVRLAGLADERR